MHKLIVHPDRKLVGCALIQAAYGSKHYNEVIHLFDEWLLAPSEGIVFLEAEISRWEQLAKDWNAYHRSLRHDSTH